MEPLKMKYKIAAILFLLPFMATRVYGEAQSAEEVVRITSDSVIERLASQKTELEAHPERVYDVIHELVAPHFDINIMSKWILGKKNWSAATKEQQDAFIGEFKTLLIRTYAKALLEYSDEQIKYYPVQAGKRPDLAIVKTEIVNSSSGTTIPIDYRMHSNSGTWKVIDVSVDGVSLVGTYRGSFSAEINKNGIDALIAKLAERNAKLN